MKCYIINLEEASDRKQFFLNQLRIVDKDGIHTKHFDFFPAISKNNTDQMKKYCKEFNITLQGGEACCAISHLLVLRKIIEMEEEYTVIFEDDAKILTLHFFDIDNLMKEINIKEFDIMYLNNRIKHNDKYEPINGWGLEGYIVSKQGAKKIYDILTCDVLSSPIDNQIQSHIKGMKIARSCHRKKLPNLWLKAYRTKTAFVKHFPNGHSYIGRPKGHWLLNNET